MVDSIHRLPPLPQTAPVQPSRTSGESSSLRQSGEARFGELFEKALEQEPLRFSAHAQSRLLSRSIQLDGGQIDRLQEGVQRAAQKGARDSLVMMDNLAFIINVEHRTVVTAFDGAGKTGNVFTQIDSAVIV